MAGPFNRGDTVINKQFTLFTVCKLETLLFMICVKVAYISNKPPLVGEHTFPLMEFVGWPAHVTFSGSGGIMSTARSKLLYSFISKTKSRGQDFSEEGKVM